MWVEHACRDGGERGARVRASISRGAKARPRPARAPRHSRHMLLIKSLEAEAAAPARGRR